MKNKYLKNGLLLFLAIGLILFTQGMKLVKNPGSAPITKDTILGLLVLWFFSMLGLLIGDMMKKTGIEVLANFPVLGWVSLVSLFFCIASDFFVRTISAVDFLSLTTPVLAFAGISVANQLEDLSKTSWKVAIVAVFVFIGTYVGSATIAQIGLILSGR